MKITCTQENLKAGLAVVGRILSSNNTLPILNNFLIRTENGLLKVSSTNLEIAITTSIRCRVEEEGSITVVGKTLTELVNNLPNKNITLETKQTELLIEAEGHHTKIKTLPSEEFPLIPKVESKAVLSLDPQELKKALDQVSFAASTNQTQPEISGIFMSYEGAELRVTATDRYRLAERKMKLGKIQDNFHEAIIPQKTTNEISRIIGNQTGLVEVGFSETQAVINFSETEIVSRLVEGQYPDYKQIIPTNFETNAVVDRGSLTSALRTAAVFSQGNNSVKLELFTDKQQLVLTAESSDLGKSVVEIPVATQGKDAALILNYHYLLDCLSVMDTKNVVIKIINDDSPSLVVPEGQDDYIYLVMPIKS